MKHLYRGEVYFYFFMIYKDISFFKRKNCMKQFSSLHEGQSRNWNLNFYWISNNNHSKSPKTSSRLLE